MYLFSVYSYFWYKSIKAVELGYICLIISVFTS